MKKYCLTSMTALLLLLLASSVHASNTVKSNFTDIPIDVGKKIWFSSVVRISGKPTYPLTIYLTNQQINSPAFNHSIPNGILILDPSVTVATTVFNGTAWVTTAKPNEQGYYFVSGYSDSLAEALPAGIGPVSWTGTFTASRPGISLFWQMGAAVYSSFSGNMNSLAVKPSDCGSCSFYHTPHNAGTPEHYFGKVIAGAMGNGGTSYTGDLSEPFAVEAGLASGNTYICAGSTIAITPGSLCSNWASSSPSVASVSNDGQVTGVAPGTARISYILTGYPVWQSVTVTVNALPTVTVIARPTPLYAGATLILNATTSTDGGFSDDAVVSWYGPDGFTSSQLRPIRTDITPMMAGVYGVTVTDHGCTVSAKSAELKLDKMAVSTTAGLLAMPTPRASFLNSTLIPGGGNNLLWPDGMLSLTKEIKTSESEAGQRFSTTNINGMRPTTRMPFAYTPTKPVEKSDPNMALLAGSILSGETPIVRSAGETIYTVSRPAPVDGSMIVLYNVPVKRTYKVDRNLVLFAGSILSGETPIERPNGETIYTLSRPAPVDGTMLVYNVPVKQPEKVDPNLVLFAGSVLTGDAPIVRANGETIYTLPKPVPVDGSILVYNMPVKHPEKVDPNLVLFAGSVLTGDAPTRPSNGETIYTLPRPSPVDGSMIVYNMPVKHSDVDPNLVLFAGSVLTGDAPTRPSNGETIYTLLRPAPVDGSMIVYNLPTKHSYEVDPNLVLFAGSVLPGEISTDNTATASVENNHKGVAVSIIHHINFNETFLIDNATATADVFADDKDHQLTAAIAARSLMEDEDNSSSAIADAGALSTRHTNMGTVRVRSLVAMNANSGGATASLWTKSRDGRLIPPRPRARHVFSDLNLLAVNSLSNNGSPPAEEKDIGTANSPPAIGVAHSPPIIGVANSPPAIGMIHSPPIRVAHSPPSLGVAHSPPAVGVAHSPPALGVAHSPPAIGIAHSPPAISIGNAIAMPHIGTGCT